MHSIYVCQRREEGNKKNKTKQNMELQWQQGRLRCFMSEPPSHQAAFVGTRLPLACYLGQFKAFENSFSHITQADTRAESVADYAIHRTALHSRML